MGGEKVRWLEVAIYRGENEAIKEQRVTEGRTWLQRVTLGLLLVTEGYTWVTLGYRGLLLGYSWLQRVTLGLLLVTEGYTWVTEGYSWVTLGYRGLHLGYSGLLLVTEGYTWITLRVCTIVHVADCVHTPITSVHEPYVSLYTVRVKVCVPHPPLNLVLFQ